MLQPSGHDRSVHRLEIVHKQYYAHKTFMTILLKERLKEFCSRQKHAKRNLKAGVCNAEKKGVGTPFPRVPTTLHH